MKKILTTLMLVLASTSVAHANPIIIGTGFTPPEIFALLGETLVIAALLARWKFDFVRMLYTWMLVTLLTYWVFMFGVGLAFASLQNVLLETNQTGVLILVAIPFEGLVVLGETVAIQRFSTRKFFRNTTEPFSSATALFVAFIGNLVSFIIGLIWIFQ